MPNEDNSQQPTNSNSQLISQLIAAVRSLEDRVIGLEPRLASVEEIIVARLNTTRPFEQQMLTRLNEIAAGQAAIREEQVAMRKEITALREDFDRFRIETNHNFRLVNRTLEHLNSDFMRIRAEHTLLEDRVSRLEETRA